MFADLDLQVLTAADEAARCAAVVAGTREVLDRLDHLASPKVLACTGPEVVLSQIVDCVRGLAADGATAFAQWLQMVVDVLDAQLSLTRHCTEDIRRAATDIDAMSAIHAAAASLQAAARTMLAYPFAPFPDYAHPSQPDPTLVAHVGTCFAAETHRLPLRTQLDGAGGAAGSAEFNPYVAALFAMELATHRRLYRLFYELCSYVGFELNVDPALVFDTPDDVDHQEL